LRGQGDRPVGRVVLQLAVPAMWAVVALDVADDPAVVADGGGLVGGEAQRLPGADPFPVHLERAVQRHQSTATLRWVTRVPAAPQSRPKVRKSSVSATATSVF